MLLTGPMVSAQQIIASNGDSKSVAGIEVSWTIGEVVIETVTGNSVILTQGFHQTKLLATAVNDPLFPDLEIKVFPNPTPGILTLKFSKYVEGSRYFLYELSGKILENKLILSEETEINMKPYANGQYILKLTNESLQEIQSFQIIKY